MYGVRRKSKLLLQLSLATAIGVAGANELAPSCLRALSYGKTIEVNVTGTGTQRMTLPAATVAVSAFFVEEKGVDVFVRALDSAGRVLVVADNPVARNGVQIVSARINGAAVAALEFEGKEHQELRGRVYVSSLSGSRHAADIDCVAMVADLVQADRDFGAAQAIRLRRAGAPRADSNALLARSLLGYVSARKQVAGRRIQDTAAVEMMLAAISYNNLDAWRAAADWAIASSINFDRLNFKYGEARAKSMLAAAWMEIATSALSPSETAGAPRDSLAILEKSRLLLGDLEVFFRRNADPYQAALQTNNIGLTYFYRADFEKAMPFFRRAERVFRELSEIQHAGLSMQNLALCDWGLGNLTKSVADLRKAVKLISPLSEPYIHAIALNNLGLASYAAGDFDGAQMELSRAYAAAEGSQVEALRARALFGLAVTAYAVGEKQSVEPLLKNVLEIWTPQVDARGRVAALRALAIVDRDDGQIAEALRHLREALALAASPSARGRILLEIAENHLLTKDVASALRVLSPLFEKQSTTDRLLTAMAGLTRATVWRELKKYDQARRDLDQSLPVFRELQDVNAEFRCLIELGRVQIANGQLPDAVSSLDQALNLSDEIRTQTTNPEYRASLATTLREAQELRLSLYWHEFSAADRRGDQRVAREAAMRALSLADTFRGSVLEELRAGTNRHGRLRTDADRQQTDNVLRQLAELRYQLTVRYDRAGSADPAAQRLRAKVAELRARMNARATQLSTRDSTIAQRIARTRSRLARLGAIFRDHAFVEYWLGSDYAFAWVLRKGRVHWVRLDEPREIRSQALRVAAAMPATINRSSRSMPDMLSTLDRILLRQVEPFFTNADELVVVPDGVLSLISFATLRNASQASRPYLVQRFFVTMTPSLGSVAIQQREAARQRFKKELLLVADPVYEQSDPRLNGNTAMGSGAVERRSVSQSNGRIFHRLVWTGQEAAQIARLLPAGSSDLLSGLDATRAGFIASKLDDYRFLHLAVHAIVDAEVPQLSALILSRYDSSGRTMDSELRAADLARLGIHAEAVVLSACSSAAGRNIDSEGVMGLQYAALVGGARSVIATYWEVEDEISAQLMTETYRRMLPGKTSPGRALSGATRQLLQAQPEADPARWGAYVTYSILPLEP